MNTYLVCYDVASDSARTKLARLLEKCGERVQRSVFRISARAQNIPSLQEKMLALMGEEDELLVLPLCASCLHSALRAGPPIPLAWVA